MSNQLILIVHVDYVLIFSKKKCWIDIFIKSFSEGSNSFEGIDEGRIYKCLGVDITEHTDRTCELKQSFLTKRFIEEINLSAFETHKRHALVSSLSLHKYLDGDKRVKPWNYRSVIGMMTCLQSIARSDESMAVHQCDRFSSNPKLSHERAVNAIGRHLVDVDNKGLMCKAKKEK